MTTHNSGHIMREPADEGRAYLTMPTGAGKTYATMAAMWAMLQADDDQDTDDTAPMTDHELDEALAAVKSRDVERLPTDIEELSDVTPYLRMRAEEEPRRIRAPFMLDAYDFRVRREYEERGEVEDLGRLIRYVLSALGRTPRSDFDFYWDCGEAEYSRTMRELKAALDDAYESVLQVWAPYRRASEHAASFLVHDKCHFADAPKVRAPRAATPYKWMNVPSLLDCCTPVFEPRCCAPRRQEEPRYLLAVFVQPEAALPQACPRMPAWFKCSDSAVTRGPAPSVMRGRWSVVVDVEAVADVAATRSVGLSAAVIELPSASVSAMQQQENIRSLWQSNWRPRVLELLESVK